MRVRLERARELLRHPAVPVAQVARRCGYRDVKHFTGSFRRTFGLTPSSYHRSTEAR